MPIEQAKETQCLSENMPQDWAKLIRKLRWLGMEDEARRLQTASLRDSATPDEMNRLMIGVWEKTLLSQSGSGRFCSLRRPEWLLMRPAQDMMDAGYVALHK